MAEGHPSENGRFPWTSPASLNECLSRRAPREVADGRHERADVERFWEERIGADLRRDALGVGMGTDDDYGWDGLTARAQARDHDIASFVGKQQIEDDDRGPEGDDSACRHARPARE